MRTINKYWLWFFGIFSAIFLFIQCNPNKPEYLPTKYTYQKQEVVRNKKLGDTREVAAFIHINKKLPSYYITKSKAKSMGWIPSKQNLCEVAPGKLIGGDRFLNKEKKLKPGTYYECDVEFQCPKRGSSRLIFNKFGEVWSTENHYKTFNKLY